ncbi:zinc-dependent alcohol dehydrogenase [Amedibacillus sp. YH-ame6]
MIKSNLAVVLTGEGQVELQNKPLPDICDDEVLVQVKACNLCTSEYGIYTGARKADFPYMFGHEWSGIVIDTGSRVTRFQKGDFVVGCYEYDASSLEAQLGNSSCAPRLYAFDKMNPDGFYGRFRACAQYVTQKEVSTFHMSSKIDASEAAFLEPLATVVSGIHKLQLKPSDKVLVIGAGTMGILNALVAKVYGCSVYQSEMMEKKIKTAKELGIQVIDVSKGNSVETIKRESGVDGFDVVIVAVGVSAAYKQAFELLKEKEGTVLFFAAGFPEPEINIGPNEIHYRKMTIVGTYTANFQDFEEATMLLSERKIDVSKLVEKKIDFERCKDAFEEASIPGAFRVSMIF